MNRKPSKKDEKKEGTPSPAVLNPFMLMTPTMLSQWQTQMATMGSASSTKEATIYKPPWDTTDSSATSDDDFPPSQKKRKASSGTASQSQAQTLNKRKPGRPKKVETQLKEAQTAADNQILATYHKLSTAGDDKFPLQNKDECMSCRLWTGMYALIPCGHGKYCHSCVGKLKIDALKLQRPGKCLSDSCHTLVTSWVKLYNVAS